MGQNTTYHRVLRISAVICALVLVFESGLLSESTKQMSENAHLYMANAIGMSASVQPTELNELTAGITQRQQELDAREAALSEREISVGLSTSGSAGNDTAIYVLSSILFILLVLILLNYVLDYLRTKERQDFQPV